MKKKIIGIVIAVGVIAGIGSYCIIDNKNNNLEMMSEFNNKVVSEISKEVSTKNEVVKTEPKVDTEEIISVESAVKDINESNVNIQNTYKNEEENTTENIQNVAFENNASTNDVQAVEETTYNNVTENSTSFMSEVEQYIFSLVNEERAKVGLPQLSYNSTMEYYARLKSKDMGDRNYFDHNNPEGKLITETMNSDGVYYNAWGENIAYISKMTDPYEVAKRIMTNWMNSQGHRENILSTNFTSIGVGVYEINNKIYATQEFFR